MVDILLDPSKSCPYAYATKGTIVLFDSGAVIPVWTRSVDLLLSRYKDAKQLKERSAAILGFGGVCNVSDIYIIPELSIQGITIYHLTLAVVELENMYADLVLSFECMHRFICEFRDVPKTLRIDIAHLYARSMYRKNILIHESIYTKEEVQTMKTAHDEIMRYSVIANKPLNTIVDDILSLAPNVALGSPTRFPKEYKAYMLWESYKHALKI